MHTEKHIPLVRRLAKLSAASLLVAFAVSGCAVYEPAPVYASRPYYGPPVVVQPAPVYAAPAVGLGFRFWGGDHHRRFHDDD